MNQEDFKKEYYYQWTISDEYKKAYDLWIWYQYQCEKYDRIICVREYYDTEGFIKPLSNQEYKLININAYNQMKYIEKTAKEYGIEKDNWFNAKQDVARLAWKGIQEEYKRIYES